MEFWRGTADESREDWDREGRQTSRTEKLFATRSRQLVKLMHVRILLCEEHFNLHLRVQADNGSETDGEREHLGVRGGRGEPQQETAVH